MNPFLRLYKHLLPKGRAWLITIDKTLRQFFQGLTEWPIDVKVYLDQIWLDIFPETTTQLTEWENQFALSVHTTDDATRRENLLAAWRAIGGQSPGYIQEILRNAGFDVYVHEWWEIPASTPPVKRDPRLYIRDASGEIVYLTEAGEPLAEAGEPIMEAGETLDPLGYLLVNKGPTIFNPIYLTEAGEPLAEAGEPIMEAGNFFAIDFDPVEYLIPSDPDTWVYFWYVGGETFPELADVLPSRREELEQLVLKMGPAHTWVGMLINYT